MPFPKPARTRILRQSETGQAPSLHEFFRRLLRGTTLLVHIHGKVAIVTGKYRERIRVKGKAVVLTGRFTDTWIQEKNQWKCVASQSTLISH